MNDFEREHLPSVYKPLSPWAYLGLDILYCIPVLGWIFLICHALSGRNINRRNYARSFFCIYLIFILLVVLAMVLHYPLPIPAANA